MSIGGVSTILILGVVNFVLLIFQLLTGLGYFRVKFAIHRKTGILLFCCAFLHGLLAFLAT